MRRQDVQRSRGAGLRRCARAVSLLLVVGGLVAAGASAGSRQTTGKTAQVRIAFTGAGGGRYLDVTRWLREDTRECYARRTADETVRVSWRLTWTATLARTASGYTLRAGKRSAGKVAGRVTGTAVRDSCDAAEEEEPGWAGSDRCSHTLPIQADGRLQLRRSREALRVALRGPTFGSPGRPCELTVRNDQLAAHLELTAADLARLARGATVTSAVGTRHPRRGDTFLETKKCSAFPHIYEGVVYLYDCDDTLIWHGSVAIVPS